jgi:cytochrome c oxidase subunit III
VTHEPSQHDAHDHPPHLAHHWETPQQQFEAGKLGMWLFLATEVLFFGGLFVAYAVWRGNNPDLFQYGHIYLGTKWGAINTVVLILSSLTMAMAVTYAQTNRRNALVTCLALTFLGGLIFMGIKYVEYSEKYWEGIVPGAAFYDPPPDPARSKYWVEGRPIVTRAELLARAEEAPPPAVPAELREAGVEVSSIVPPRPSPAGISIERIRDGRPDKVKVHPLQDPNRPINAHMFFNIYYFMTGLHGIHVVVGLGLIAWLGVRAMKGHFTSEYFTPVDLGGLYWHLVDLIWIFLFPLFYLI